MTNLNNCWLELEAKLCQSTEHTAAFKVREDVVKRNLATFKEELATSRLECDNALHL